LDNQSIVEAFIAAINSNKKAAIMDFFAGNACYHNIPLTERHGKHEIWQELSQLSSNASNIDWKITAIACNQGGQVLTERRDRFEVNGKQADFKVMGIFELTDGKITHWRDYFDVKTCMSQL